MKEDQLRVYLSLRDACYGLRQWDIAGTATVATVRRAGWRPSGIRHRLPLDLRTNDGTVVCRVKKSRALKAMASRYQVLDPAEDVLGTVERKQTKQADLHQRLLDSDGRLLGVLRRVDAGTSSSREYRYEEPVEGSLEDLELRRTGAELKQAGTWSVSGLRSVSEESRLLVVAHQLIIEPWAAGENAADKTTKDHHY